MLCHFDPTGNNVDEAAITTMSEKIRQLLNVMWRNKFSLKVDKIENPFNKRTLPLRCFKGEQSGMALIVWKFFQIRKITSQSHKCTHL